MRGRSTLIASSAGVLAGAIGMAATARLAPEVPPYLLAPASQPLGPALVIDRVALVILLIGLPAFGLALGSRVALPKVVLPMRIVGCCAGLLGAGLLLLGIVWGTASSSEVLPVDTSVADVLGGISEALMAAAFTVGAAAALVARSRSSRTSPPRL